MRISDWSSDVCSSDLDAWLVESKSLKLYLGAFRNHGAFHEDCPLAIGRRLVAELAPKWMRIGGYWYPSGGMPIDVFWQPAAPPAGPRLPDQGAAHYSGRGQALFPTFLPLDTNLTNVF